METMQKESEYCTYTYEDSEENRQLAETLFSDHEEHPTLTECKVTGNIPKWINGFFIQLAPAKFNWGETSYKDLFDGDAMANMYLLKEGKVSFMNRFLDTDYYLKNKKYNKISSGGFGHGVPPDPCQSFFRRWFTYFNPMDLNEKNDNTVISLHQMAGKIYAATEMPFMNEIDPKTLEVTKKISMSNIGKVGMTRMWLAHVHQDPNGATWVISTNIPKSYDLVRMHNGTTEVMASMPIDGTFPLYYHSFAMTENYVILALNPFLIDGVFSILKASMFHYAFSDILKWHPEKGLVFRIIDRRTMQEVRSCIANTQFVFHHCNAYEVDGEIVLDVVGHKDASLVQQLKMDVLRNGLVDQEITTGNLCRYRIPIAELSNKDAAPYKFPISVEGLDYELLAKDFEFPLVEASREKKDYTFTFGISKNLMYTSLMKINVKTKETWTWTPPAFSMANEPQFIQRPGATEEDDGVIISTISATSSKTSFLVVLDAKSFKEIGRAELSHKMPNMIHGKFFQ